MCAKVETKKVGASLVGFIGLVTSCTCAKDEGCELSENMEGVMEVVFFLICAQRESALYLANFVLSYSECSLNAHERPPRVREVTTFVLVCASVGDDASWLGASLPRVMRCVLKPICIGMPTREA